MFLKNKMIRRSSRLKLKNTPEISSLSEAAVSVKPLTESLKNSSKLSKLVVPNVLNNYFSTEVINSEIAVKSDVYKTASCENKNIDIKDLDIMNNSDIVHLGNRSSNVFCNRTILKAPFDKTALDSTMCKSITGESDVSILSCIDNKAFSIPASEKEKIENKMCNIKEIQIIKSDMHKHTDLFSKKSKKRGKIDRKTCQINAGRQSNLLVNYFISSKSPSIEKNKNSLPKPSESIASTSSTASCIAYLVQNDYQVSDEQIASKKAINYDISSVLKAKNPEEVKSNRKRKRQKKMGKQKVKKQLQKFDCEESNVLPTEELLISEINIINNNEQSIETNNVYDANKEFQSSIITENKSALSTEYIKAKSKNKRNIKKKVFSSTSETNSLILETTIIKNVSDRKQSLRSKRLMHDRDILDKSIKRTDEEQTHNAKKLSKLNKNLKITEDIFFDSPNTDLDDIQEPKVYEIHKKKEAKNLKLFPIFSPTSKTSSSSYKSVKRKVDEPKELSIEIASKCSKKSKVNCKKEKKIHVISSEKVPFSGKRKQEKEVCRNRNIEIPDSGFKSDFENRNCENILILEDTDHLKKSNLNIFSEATGPIMLKNTNDKISKEYLVSFPVFTHVADIDQSFPCSVSTHPRFIIQEDVEHNFIPNVSGSLNLFESQDLRSEIFNKTTIENDYSFKRDISEENNLWTDSSEKLRSEDENSNTVRDIKSWLLQWKNKFSDNSRKNYLSDSEYSCNDSDDDFIDNCIIISGPTGTGKTSIVFSLAKELGFTVLEMNASSCRTGRIISNQLKEALESYHMENVKLPSLISIIDSEDIKESHPKKNASVKQTKAFHSLSASKVLSPKKKNTSSCQKDKTIANYFLGCTKDKEKQIKGLKIDEKSSRQALESNSNDLSGSKYTDPEIVKKSCKISGLTIILFDDVDVVFEEDEGFWSTVKGFLKISKKPVILTVGRNISIVKSTLNTDIQVFHMKPSLKSSALTAVKKFCQAHSREKSRINLDLLTSHNVCDIRRNILNAQFWTQQPLRLKGIDDFSLIDSLLIFNPININTFISGDLPFSIEHIKKLLFGSLPTLLSYAILQFHSVGYDILFSNIFRILYDFKSVWKERSWEQLTSQLQGSHSVSQSFKDSEMWKEACELFQLKKKALISGSSSQKLEIFATAISDLSFTDLLKGFSKKTFHCVTVPERVKMWTAGLPICSDKNLGASEDMLNIIALIDIYLLRKLQKTMPPNQTDLTPDVQLELDHPFTNYDRSFSYNTEDCLEMIASVLPASYLLNKSALVIDYLSIIKIMSQNEKNRESKNEKRSRRFLHYFDSISFNIDRKKL